MRVRTRHGRFLVSSLWIGGLALYTCAFPPRVPAQVTLIGSEFRVNTYTTGEQRGAGIAANADGSFVVVWAGHEVANDEDVFGQRYNSSGTAVGGEFQVNTYTTGGQGYYFGGVGVSADAVGNFVVVWGSNGQDGDEFGVFGQRFSSAGSPLGGEFQANTYTTGDQGQGSVDVASDSAGNFVVVWSSIQQPVGGQDGSESGVFARRYSSSGTPIGGEFQVNSYTTDDQGGPYGVVAVASDPDGDFVVVWNSYGQDGYEYGVFGKRYGSSGTPVGSEFQVNTYTTGEQASERGQLDVAMRSDGSFLVVWPSGDGQEDGVWGRLFDSNGAPQSADFQVNATTLGDQGHYRVAAAADAGGNFVVVWDGAGQDDPNGVFGRRLDATGTPVGGEFRANTTVQGYQGAVNLNRGGIGVATDGAGDFVVVWNGTGYVEYDFKGVFAQRFAPDADGIPVTSDNCPNETNPDLLDSDNDGAGDVCDACPLLVGNSCEPTRSGGTSVDSAGGTLSTPDGSITVQVPAGGLATDTSISVTESINGFVIDPEGSFLALYKVGMGPDGQHFSQPVTITFRWDDRDSDGRVDRGTCQGGPDVGLSCDANADCAGSTTCSKTANPTEGNLILKRNAQRFSKNGFGATVTEAKCVSHQSGGGCETAVADCTDATGTGMATVANCCDTVNNAWVFQTCDFSEFSIGDLDTIVLPAVSPAGWTLLSGLLMLVMGWAFRRRQAGG